MDQPSPPPTSDEIRVRAWAEVRAAVELQLAPLGQRALAALAPRPGERIVDIGCGGGETALELADAVTPGGEVVGIDLSAAVLGFARRAAEGHPRLRFVQGDAQVFPFEPAAFDAAFSRFGVMFFADPIAAFANIRRSLKPGGRLAFLCWRALQENPLDILPLRAASPHLPPQADPDPDVPGPFALADPQRVRSILEAAGFGDIEITARDERVGSGDLDAMLAVCSQVGALGKILRENPELRDAALPAVRAALAEHDGPNGVRLNAATWVVTARAAGRATTETEGELVFAIREDDLTAEPVRALLALHLSGMHASSPPGHVFALDLSGLQAPDVTVWSVWDGDHVVGVGALKALGDRTGELKSMRTDPRHLRRGVAAALLEHIISEARRRGLRRVSLETGSGPAFEPALALYRKRGFCDGDAFGDYVPSDFNQFLHLPL